MLIIRVGCIELFWGVFYSYLYIESVMFINETVEFLVKFLIIKLLPNPF